MGGATPKAIRTSAEVTLDGPEPLERAPGAFRGRRIAVRIDPGRGIGHHAKVYTAGARAPERFKSLTTLSVPHVGRFLTETVRYPRQLRLSWYMFFFQLRGLADHVVEHGARLAAAGIDRRQRLQQPVVLGRFHDSGDKTRLFHRLGQEVIGARTHRCDNQVRVHVRGQHEHRRVRDRSTQRADQRDTIDLAQLPVQKHDLRSIMTHDLRRFVIG